MNERGFTLLELLIAAAIGGVVLLGVSGFYFSALRFNAESSAQTYLQRQAELVLDEMARQIRPATALTIATCTGIPSSLQVTNTSGTFCFRQSGAQLLEDLPGGTGTRNLLSGSPSPLTVTSFSATLSGTAVTVTFQLQDQTFKVYDPSTAQMTFATTLVRRN